MYIMVTGQRMLVLFKNKYSDKNEAEAEFSWQHYSQCLIISSTFLSVDFVRSFVSVLFLYNFIGKLHLDDNNIEIVFSVLHSGIS